MDGDKFIVSIIGLGLMGGSFAYALHGFKNCRIIGYDIDDTVLRKALAAGAIDKTSNSIEDAVGDADLTMFCSSPSSILSNMKKAIPFFKKGSVITDICGVKQEIISFIAAMFPERVDYIGLHPMAGKEVGGFDNAEPSIFNKAGFIIILPEKYHEESVTLLKELSLHVGAGRICINSAEEHDKIIAYTSDLMHISATTLCLNYPQNMTMAHAAGAFIDCTRIANIDAGLWTDLLTRNADNIIPNLERYINNLTDFKKAIERNDKFFMNDFLSICCANKKEMLTL